MTWLAWRQLRTSAASTYAVLLLSATLFAVTGPALAHLAATSGDSFLNRAQGNPADSTLYDIGWIAVLAIPPLFGAFWGAPLISSELTAGTHRLVWNQTVSRTRWLVTKLVVCGAAAMAATGLLSVAFGWWSSPIDKALDATTTSVAPAGFWFPRMAEETFAARGVAPIGYAAFAFMLGVTLGLVLRRLLPAMALTGVGYIVAQVVMNLWIRPALLAPDHLVMRINGTFNIARLGTILPNVPEPGAWVIKEQLIDDAGHPATMPSWAPDCFGNGRGSQACLARMHRLYQVLVTYQPAGRFWTLQSYELAVYLALAVALSAFCVYWIRARVS
ncbi:MAG TPA: ABC transporter permease [Trebonia sp.]